MASSSHLHNSIRCSLRAVAARCSVPQQRAIRELLLAIMKEGTTIINDLCARKSVRIGKQAERYRRHLGNTDIATAVEKRIFRTLPDVREDTVISYDIGDICKNAAKKMEGLQNIFDGSERRRGRGYFLHGVSIHDQPVVMELHDDNRYTLNQTRLAVIDRIIAHIGTKGIWLFDRWNDDQKLFSDLTGRELRFIVRIKTNRKLIHKQSGMRVPVPDFLPGIYEVVIPGTQEEYLLVVHQHHPDLQPIRMITNVEAESAKEICETYLARWEVENLYRQMKRKYDLEAVRLLSLRKIRNMIALVQLATSISNLAFDATVHKEAKELSHAFRQYCYHRCLHENRFSFTTFLSTVVPDIPMPQSVSSQQLSLFSWRQVGKMGVL